MINNLSKQYPSPLPGPLGASHPLMPRRSQEVTRSSRVARGFQTLAQICSPCRVGIQALYANSL